MFPKCEFSNRLVEFLCLQVVLCITLLLTLWFLRVLGSIYLLSLIKHIIF